MSVADPVSALSTTATASLSTSTSTFRPNPHYNFPPFFTLQPNLTTRQSQLASWSSLLLSYCSHHRLFRLSSSHPIFANTQLNRRLKPEDVRLLFAFMVDSQHTAEWVDVLTASSASSRRKSAGVTEREEIYVFWHSAEEWASVVLAWVEGTGQRNTVLTFYELLEGDVTEKCEWRGMPEEVLGRVLGVLVRRGRAGLMGEGEGRGVKMW